MEVTRFSIGLPIRAAKSEPPPQGVAELFVTDGSFIHGARADSLAVELASHSGLLVMPAASIREMQLS
jgi:hypothetical protein